MPRRDSEGLHESPIRIDQARQAVRLALTVLEFVTAQAVWRLEGAHRLRLCSMRRLTSNIERRLSALHAVPAD